MHGFAHLRTGELDQPSHRCPCCRSITLRRRAAYQVCPVCLWEDDGREEQHASECRSGAHGRLSLSQARLNYARYGACEPGLAHLSRRAPLRERADIAA